MKTKRYLNAEEVKKLCQLRAKIKKALVVEEKLETRLKEKMKQGYICPQVGPYLLTLTREERVSPPWRKLFRRHIALCRFNGDNKAAEKYLERVAARTKPQDIYKLLVKVNAEYERRAA